MNEDDLELAKRKNRKEARNAAKKALQRNAAIKKAEEKRLGMNRHLDGDAQHVQTQQQEGYLLTGALQDRGYALEWTLRDMTEDLALLYSTIVRKFVNLKSVADMNRFDKIQDSIQGWRQNLQAKADDRLLVAPQKQRFIQRMMFVHGRYKIYRPFIKKAHGGGHQC